jgi:hypothetical protein
MKRILSVVASWFENKEATKNVRMVLNEFGVRLVQQIFQNHIRFKPRRLMRTFRRTCDRLGVFDLNMYYYPEAV